ncbi:nucleotidyltransferase domain-containing protein [Oceanobacillus oncorhynchi]
MMEKNITMEFDEISIYQFGSSLNTQTPNDIDLLIVYRNRSYKEIIKLIRLRRTLRIQLQRILGIPIDIVLLSNKEERQLLYLDQINYKKLL